MRFRYHKTKIQDSIVNVIEFKNYEELAKIIAEQTPQFEVEASKLHLNTYCGYNPVTEWDEWSLTLDDLGLIGYIDARSVSYA